MSDSRDRAIELEARQALPARPKTLQFALVMLAGCVVLTLLIGVLFRQVAPPGPSVAQQPRLNMAVPPRGAAKTAANVLEYHADASGHFFVDAAVNGTMIRFLVDTGASVVALSPDDARAAGISEGLLQFSQAVNTANGQTHAAPATLRSVRLEQFEMLEVPAMVMQESMPVSLLGMSFLKRLEGYSIRDGVLTIEW
jgi:aspartyl protease family protein